MRVWVLVSWETDLTSDTVGVFASRERAERYAGEEVGRELEWKEERERGGRGRPFRIANVGAYDGYAVEEFELIE